MSVFLAPPKNHDAQFQTPEQSNSYQLQKIGKNGEIINLQGQDPDFAKQFRPRRDTSDGKHRMCNILSHPHTRIQSRHGRHGKKHKHRHSDSHSEKSENTEDSRSRLEKNETRPDEGKGVNRTGAGTELSKFETQKTDQSRKERTHGSAKKRQSTI